MCPQVSNFFYIKIQDVCFKKNIQSDWVKVYNIFTVARKHLGEDCFPHAILSKRLVYRDICKKPAIFHSQLFNL